MLVVLLLISAMQVAVVRFRVNRFAPRGCRGRNRADVLRLRSAINESRWIIRWLLGGLE
jgi:hypothetical protein